MNKVDKSKIKQNDTFLSNYKGLFNKNKKKINFYEGNAHFSYKVLYKKLEILEKNNKNSNHKEQRTLEKKSSSNLQFLLKKKENKEQKIEIKEVEKKKNISKKIVLYYHKNKKDESSMEMSYCKMVSFECKKVDSFSKSFLSTNIEGKSRQLLSNLSQSSVNTVISNITIRNDRKNYSEEKNTLKMGINMKKPITKIKINYLNLYKRTNILENSNQIINLKSSLFPKSFPDNSSKGYNTNIHFDLNKKVSMFSGIENRLLKIVNTKEKKNR